MQKKGERKVRKKLLAILLVCCLIAPILFQNPLETEAATDQYGFNLETPEDFDAKDGQNPYGAGEVALNPIMEPFVLSSSNSDMHVDYWNDVNLYGNSALDGDRVSLVSQSGGSDVNMMVSKAYDPDGSGHDYMAAVLGISGDSKLVLWYYNTRTKEKSERYTVHQFGGEGADWFGSINQWEYTSYFTLTAGDFDGDGGDELAVYVPERGNPYVQILKPSGNTYQPVQQIPYTEIMGDYAKISDNFTNNGDSKRSMVQASLEAADLDRDGKEELVILGAFADLPEGGNVGSIPDRSSRLGIYRLVSGDKEASEEKDTPQNASADQDTFKMERWGDAFALNNSGSSEFSITPIFMRTASCAAGDIDNDGFPELVVAGYYAGGNAKNDGLDGGQFAMVTMKYETPTDDQDSGEMHLGTFQKVGMNPFVKGGLYTSDAVQAPPALTCVAVDGRNAAEQVFLAGTMYSYNDTWIEEKIAHDCRENTKWADNAKMITNAYVQTAVAGNFDGNNMGIEQVYYTRGLKQNLMNYYWYDICVLGRVVEDKDGEDTVVVGSDGKGTWFDRRYGWVHRHRKGDKNLFLSLAAVDADDDTDTIVYKRKEFTYTDANVMAILQAAPYFEDLKDNYYDGVGETVFGQTQGSGGSTSTTKSASAGAYFNSEIPLPFMKIEISASYTHDWEWEYEKETTIEYSLDFSGGQMEDSVVLYRTPMTLYYYDVHPAGGGKTKSMTVGIPENPVYNVMDKDEYNAIASNDDMMKDKVVTSSILPSTPGQPSSYYNSAAGLQDFTGSKEYINATSGVTTGNISQTITKGEQTSASQSYNNTFELSLGVAFGDDVVGGGVSGGGGWGGGSTTFEYSDVSKTGMVANPPESEYPYSFRWKFGTWRVNLGDTQVPVLGYLVNDVIEPPSLPQNIAVSKVTQDSITISWDHGVKRPISYEIYQYFEDSVGDNGYSLIATVDSDTKEFTYDGLEPNNSYSLSIRSVGTDEDGNKTMSEYSPLVTGTTLQEGSELSVDSITEEQTVCPGDRAVFEVDATPSMGAASGLSYAWQVQKADSTSWQNLQSGSSKLILNNVTEDMDGNKYRCVVSEVQSGKRFYVYSGVGVLHVGRVDSSVTVSALHDENNVGSADYVSETKETVDVETIRTIEVTTPETVEDAETSVKENVTETYQIYENSSKEDQTDSSVEEEMKAASEETGDEEPALPAEINPDYVYRSVSDNNYYALINLEEGDGGKTGKAVKRILLTEREDYFAENEDGSDPIADLRPDDLQGPQEVYVYEDAESEKPTSYLTWQVVRAGEEGDGTEQEPGSGEGGQTEQEPGSGEEEENKPATGVLFNLYTKNSEDSSSDNLTYYQLVDNKMVKWDGRDADGTLIYENGTFKDPCSLMPVYSSEPGTENIGNLDYSVQYDRTDNTDDKTIVLYSLEKEDGTTEYYLVTEAGEGEDSGDDTEQSSLQQIYLISQSGMLGGEDDAQVYYAKPATDPEMITEQQEKVSYEQKDGDAVTLRANVMESTPSESGDAKSVAGKVTFQIVNNRTGEITTVSADAGEDGVAEASWTPKAAGNYTITATFGGNEVLNSSSASTVYYATDGPDGTVGYVLARTSDGSGDVVYGDEITLTLKKAVAGNDGNVTLEEPDGDVTATYTVQYVDLDASLNQDEQNGSGTAADPDADKKVVTRKEITGTPGGVSYTPDVSGTHTFTAAIENADGEAVSTASATVNVLKRPVTMTAPSDDEVSSSNITLPQIADVEVSYTGSEEAEQKEAIIETDKETYALNGILQDVITTPELTKESGANNYVTSLGYKTTGQEENSPYILLVQQFLNRYDVTMKNGLYQIIAGIFDVTYESGVNGSLRALKDDNKMQFDSGTSLTEGTNVEFIADPAENFKVENWTVTENGQEITLGEDDNYKLSDDNTKLKIASLDATTDVKVTFEPASYKLNFEAGENGDVSAQYVTEGKDPIPVDSGDSVLSGSRVQLTAQPKEGYVVESWTMQKDGEEKAQVIKNEDGSNYAKNTLDIEKMDSDINVCVNFEEAGDPLKIATSVVDADGAQLAGGSIRVTGDGYTADAADASVGTAVKGSALTFTAEIPANMIVREWRVSDGDGNIYQEGEQGYEVVSGHADSYTVYNVRSDLNVEIMVAVIEPYTLTYGTAPNAEGSVTSLQNIKSGASLDRYSYDALEFRVSPDKGYEIDTVTVKMGDQTVTGGETPSGGESGAGDNAQTETTTAESALTYRTETIENSADRKLVVSPGAEGFTGDVDVTVSFKPITPSVEVSYSLYDLGDGTHGTIQASVDRLGDGKYKQTGEETGNGEADSVTLEEKVYRDSVITFTAKPEDDYRVAQWYVNDEPVEYNSKDRNTFTYTVGADDKEPIHVMAQMEQAGNKVTFGAVNVLGGEEAGGTVSAVNKLTGNVFHTGNMLTVDTELVFTAKAADGYEVVGWKLNDADVTEGVSEDKTTFTATIPANDFTEVQAVFDRIPYTVSWSAEGGTVTAENTTDQVDVTSGDQVRGGRKLTFTAEANDGMKFAGWTVTGATVTEEQLSNNPLTLTVDGDVSVKANFEVKGSHTLTFGSNSDDGKMGTLTAKVGDDVLTSGVEIPSNSKVTFTARPAEGYLVEGWYSSADAETKIEGTKYEQNEYVLDGLNEDTTVYVVFEKIPSYFITVAKDGAGSGSLQVLVDGKEARPEDAGEDAATADGSGVYTVTRHSKVEVRAVPEDEFNYLSAWNGETAQSDTFTIEDVTEAATITATFAAAEIVPVKFDVPEQYRDDWKPSVAIGTGEDHSKYETINAVGKEGQVVRGKNVLFKVEPPEGKMIGTWGIQYADGTTVTGRELGLNNELLVEKAEQGMTVTVELVDIQEYEVPANAVYDIDEDGAEDYTITDQKVTPDVLPDTPEYENTVRANGDVSFLVTPADGKWITDIRLAPESDEDEKQESVIIKEELKAKTLSGAKSGEDENILSYTKNADGSCLVTIQNVTRDLKLIVDTVNYYTVTMESPQHGKLTARDAAGNVIQNGDNVAEGTAITFTAAPEKHYRFDAWGKDAAAYADQSKEIGSVPAGENRGRSVELTMTVEGELTVSAGFTMTDHINTEIRGAKAATCTADGYTGDTCCKDCGIVLKKGAAIPAQGHQYTSTVTTEPTTRKAGVRTYICSRCGHSYTEGVETLPKPVMAKPIKVGRTKNRISWKKVKGADGYIIMADACNTRSKKAELAVKKVKTILPAGKTSWTHKKLKPATWYKYQIKAFKLVDGKRVVISETPVIHAITSGSSRYANPVKVKVQKAKISVKAGKKKKIKASVILPPNRICQQHTDEIRYVVEDKTIAMVNKKGVIRAKSRGKTAVWAVAQNGVSKKITVTVK